MFRVMLTTICLLASAHAWSQARTEPVPPGPVAGQTTPDSDSGTAAPGVGQTLPGTGIIRPDPSATADTTITPPDVDPKMQVPPPGVAAGDRKVDPK